MYDETVPVANFFLGNVNFFEKNIWYFEINPKTLLSISEKKPYSRCH